MNTSTIIKNNKHKKPESGVFDAWKKTLTNVPGVPGYRDGVLGRFVSNVKPAVFDVTGLIVKVIHVHPQFKLSLTQQVVKFLSTCNSSQKKKLLKHWNETNSIFPSMKRIAIKYTRNCNCFTLHSFTPRNKITDIKLFIFCKYFVR